MNNRVCGDAGVRRSATSAACKREDGRGAAASRFVRTRELTERARGLRRAATQAEKRLWGHLRSGSAAGRSFRRQHPVGPYALAFSCPAVRLAMEVDGGHHDTQQQRAADRRRTAWLEAKGITVLRFWNNDVLGNIEAVWTEIRSLAATPKSRLATPSLTLPFSGGGEAQEPRGGCVRLGKGA